MKDEMEYWNEIMQKTLGKEKWNSLNYWQRMCEIVALKEYIKANPIFPFLGF